MTTYQIYLATDGSGSKTAIPVGWELQQTQAELTRHFGSRGFFHVTDVVADNAGAALDGVRVDPRPTTTASVTHPAVPVPYLGQR